MQSHSSTDFEEIPSEATRKMVRDFEAHLRLSEPESYEEEEEEEEVNEEEEKVNEEEEQEEEEFSFSLDSSFNFSTISADDAFFNGQIKPAAFPLFNQALILEEGEDLESLMAKDRVPKVNRVFIPAGEATSFSKPEEESISGPYCEWSNNKVVEVSAPAPDTCKKSNSTGFSKIWRFKEFMHRSNSDGRDAFVFLNHNHGGTTSSGGQKEEKVAAAPVVAAAAAPAKKVKEVKKAAVAMSSHEVYLRSKAKDSERRRSYLPYRPAVGLFTNVNGGALTRNVHPF